MAARHRRHLRRQPTSSHGLHHSGLIVVAMAVGVVVGVPAARLVKMTAMPQMVAIFNGVGGGAAALVVDHRVHRVRRPKTVAIYQIARGRSSASSSAASRSAGSAVAFAKLQELMTGRPITYPGQQAINALVGVGSPRPRRRACWSPPRRRLLWIAARRCRSCSASIFVLPIGGADVPGPHLAAQLVHRPRRRGVGFMLDSTCSSSPARSSARRARCSPG